MHAVDLRLFDRDIVLCSSALELALCDYLGDLLRSLYARRIYLLSTVYLLCELGVVCGVLPLTDLFGQLVKQIGGHVGIQRLYQVGVF